MLDANKDEITFAEIISFIWYYKWLLTGLTFVSMACAYLWLQVVAQPIWESSAVINVGRYWQESASKSESIESFERLKIRLKSPSYLDAVMRAVNLPMEKQAVAKADVGAMVISEIKGSDVLQLTLRADSPELAQYLLQAAISELQIQHGVLLEDPVQTLLDQKAILEKDKERASFDVDVLKRKLQAEHAWNSFDVTLAATVLRDKTNELRDLQQKLLAINEHLNFRTTFNTWIVRKVVASGGPVFPRRVFTLILSAAVGLAVALLIAFIHSQFIRKSTEVI